MYFLLAPAVILAVQAYQSYAKLQREVQQLRRQVARLSACVDLGPAHGLARVQAGENIDNRKLHALSLVG